MGRAYPYILNVIPPVFLLAFCFFMEWGQLSAVSQSVQWERFFAAVFLVCISMFIHSLRWRKFFSEPNLTISNVFRAVAVGRMFNSFLPSMPGEFVRAAFLKRISGLPYMNVLSTCAVERTMDGAVALGLMGLGVWQFGENPMSQEVAALAFVLWLAAAFFLLALYFLPGKKLMDFKSGLKRIKNLKMLMETALYTLAYGIFNILTIWLLLSGLNLAPELKSFTSAMFITGILAVARALLITPVFAALAYYPVYEVLIMITENTEGTLGDAGLFAMCALLIQLAYTAPNLVVGAASFYSLPKKLSR